MNRRTVVVLILGLAVFAPFGAGAAVSSVSHVVLILDRLAGWLFSALTGLAVVFFIFAAFNYLTAAGNPEKASAASQMLLYAALALAVGLVAKGVVFLVRELIG